MLGKKTADLDSTRAQWAEQVTKYARGSTHKGDENKWGSWVEPVAIEPASRGEGGAKSSHVATPLEILERFMVADERQVPKLVDQLVDEVSLR